MRGKLEKQQHDNRQHCIRSVQKNVTTIVTAMRVPVCISIDDHWVLSINSDKSDVRNNMQQKTVYRFLHH